MNVCGGGEAQAAILWRKRMRFVVVGGGHVSLHEAIETAPLPPISQPKIVKGVLITPRNKLACVSFDKKGGGKG